MFGVWREVLSAGTTGKRNIFFRERDMFVHVEEKQISRLFLAQYFLSQESAGNAIQQ